MFSMLSRRPGHRVDAVLDRRVLGRQAEGIESHRMKNVVALHPPEAGMSIGRRHRVPVPDVNRAGRIRVHRQLVPLRPRVVVVNGVQPVAGPPLLPLGFDLHRLIPGARLSSTMPSASFVAPLKRGEIRYLRDTLRLPARGSAPLHTRPCHSEPERRIWGGGLRRTTSRPPGEGSAPLHTSGRKKETRPRRDGSISIGTPRYHPICPPERGRSMADNGACRPALKGVTPDQAGSSGASSPTWRVPGFHHPRLSISRRRLLLPIDALICCFPKR